MSGSGSFGIKTTASYGTEPTIVPARVLDRGSDTRGEFMFVKASGAVTAYDAGIISAAGLFVSVTTTTASTTPKIVGIAQCAAATGEYLWVFIGNGGGIGKGIKVRVAASYVLGTKVYTTATAGVLDDAVTAGVLTGVIGLTTDSGSGSSVEIQAAGIMYSNI